MLCLFIWLILRPFWVLVKILCPVLQYAVFCRAAINYNLPSWTDNAICSVYQAAKTALSAGKSVVSDNTNPSSDARKDYINLAKSQSKPLLLCC